MTANADIWIITEQTGEVTQEMIDSAITYARASGSTGSTWTESNESGETGSVTVRRMNA